MRVAIAAVLLALLCAVPAEAYELAGAKWPRGRVSYYVGTPQHQAAIAAAVRAWNGSGARVRFTRTRSRRRARLVIAYRGTSDWACRHGEATVGRARRARLYLPRLQTRSPDGDLICTRTMVHELGHVLGLSHEDGTCAAMNAVGVNLAPSQCPRHPPWSWRCRLLEVDDVRGAVIRYGGRVRAPHEPAECELYPAAAPVAELTTAYDSRITAITTTFRRPAASPVPPWLMQVVSNPDPTNAYAIHGARDTCPAAPAEPFFYYESPPGSTEQHQLKVDGPGRWCVAVWHIDELGRPSAAPSTAFIDVR